MVARGRLVWLLALAACRLDISDKNACRSQRDCVGERVCVEGSCTLALDAGRVVDAGNPEQPAMDAAQADVGPWTPPPELDGESPRVDGNTHPDAGRDAGTSQLGCGPLHVAPAGTGDGSSWETASGDLQAMIDAAAERAAAGCSELGAVEVWVASGSYRPPGEVSRSGSFELRSHVAVLGGFAGDEGRSEQRDPSAHLTILSGDRQGDDQSGNVSDNSLHVVRATGVDRDARLDGFVITAGNADNLQSGIGAGLFYTSASPTLRGLMFVGNQAKQGGGALGGMGGHPLVQDTVIAANQSDAYGGGAYLISGQASFERVLFLTNRADSYGGLLSNADLTLRDVRFVGNVAEQSTGLGGGLGGNPDVDLTIQNALFVGNEGFLGAAASFSGETTVVGATFARNVADGELGTALAIGSSGRLELVNSVAWHNVPLALEEAAPPALTLVASNVEGWSEPAAGNLTQDPAFVGVPLESGTWSAAPSYEPSSLQTRLTDAAADFQALGGRIVRVRVASPDRRPQYSVVARHSKTELWIWGDLSEVAQRGDAYEVLDLRLSAGSPCIGTAQPGRSPSHDLDGRPRDTSPDMGAFEHAP
jgi:hypothetical protein